MSFFFFCYFKFVLLVHESSSIDLLLTCKPTPHHPCTNNVCGYTVIHICTMQYFAFEVQINTGFPYEENVTKIQWFVMMLKTVTFVQASWRFIRIMFDYKKSPSLVKFHLLKKKKKRHPDIVKVKDVPKIGPYGAALKLTNAGGNFPFTQIVYARGLIAMAATWLILMMTYNYWLDHANYQLSN